ncbi:alginate lyase family protein [Mucilaginibacter jinjuensis]|uniref:Alginate lyase family protein n=1 Tax=Mucilaginibacter jinjuensis TaxID=1176721 RepID=A0ABY7TAJ8_9SPHI|nr:alginate lyase family protein [Mucilaginibacter jinjuensis]WCT13367.1 alginate lyase family protein [Mucilaginibacter jinjuensis]
MRTNKLIYLSLSGALVLAGLLMAKCTKNENPSNPAVKAGGTANLATNSTQVVSAAGFTHPGILNTQNSLAYACQQANSGDANRLAAYQYVLNMCNTWTSRNAYVANVATEPGAVNQQEVDFKGDALLAYATALRWAKTGDAQYATRCKQILDGWAGTFRTLSVTSGQANQVDLEASWAAPTFAAAAEIIKYYQPATGAAGGWTTAENTQFVAFLNRLKGYISNTTSTGYNNNWYTSAGYALMAIGVFEDDRTTYNNGVTIINNVIPLEMNSTGYMSGEVCVNHQDYVHYQYALTGMAYAANIAGIQGDLSIYSATSSRLLAGFTWQSGLMQGTLTAACTPNGNKTSPIWPGIFPADRHYNTAATNYIASHYATNSNGLPGGDLGFLSWTQFTHYNVPTSVN